MLRVTVELVSHGIEEKKRTLGVAIIANTGQGTLSTGTYTYTLLGKSGQVLKKGGITGFPRLRLLAWDLLLRVLHHAYGDRNKEKNNG
jgi:hypothetical protein